MKLNTKGKRQEAIRSTRWNALLVDVGVDEARRRGSESVGQRRAIHSPFGAGWTGLTLMAGSAALAGRGTSGREQPCARTT